MVRAIGLQPLDVQLLVVPLSHSDWASCSQHLPVIKQHNMAVKGQEGSAAEKVTIRLTSPAFVTNSVVSCLRNLWPKTRQ